MERLTIENAISQLGRAEDPTYSELFGRADLEIGFYRPDKIDNQTPHDRDEIYVIATGSGKFENDGQVRPVECGEVLFVAAGVPHRFLDFTDDFSTWVFFFGSSKAGGTS